MAKQIINIGSGELTGDGESLRSAFDKINDNFGELYLKDTSDFDGAFSSLTGTPTTLAGYGITDGGGSVTPSSTDTFTNKSGNISQWTNDSNYLTTVPAQTFASLTSKPTTLAGYGITDAATSAQGALAASALQSVPAQTFASLTGKPTTLAGYGITDALALGTTSTTALAGDTTFSFADITSKPTTLAGYGISDAQDALVSGTSIKTINGESLLGSGNIAISSGGSAFTNIGIGADDSTIRNISEGESFLILGGTGITTASDAEGNITITGVAQDFTFSSLTGTPTTIAGYGITDALTAGGALTGSSLEAEAVGAGVADGNDLAITGGDATEVNSTGGDANITGGSGALTSGNVNIGATQTVLVTIGSGSNNVDFPNGTTVDFTGATVTGLSVSGLQSRGSVTGTTGSLADAAEADLDITGFKSYALLTITTDRAARVRLYVTAATRTADASRAEGVDPTSDAGLIAEVITTGAETVIISPGAYGFNLESSPTTTIPCRVTNKSGGTSTVQVSLNLVQLEA